MGIDGQQERHAVVRQHHAVLHSTHGDASLLPLVCLQQAQHVLVTVRADLPPTDICL